MVDKDARPGPGERLPQHVTTPLLTLITERSLDEDYAHVAARKAEAGDASPRRIKIWSTAVVVALFGAMATIGAVQTSRDADVEELGRATLIRQVESGRKNVARLQRRISSLTDATLAAEESNAASAEQLSDVESRQRRLEIRTGYAAVRGPGVRIQVTSAPDADVNDEVRDEDLALLVNGLFQAGAEAISINDQRIVALGGIRNTNRAVHVNGRPLTPPYDIRVIGDRATLQSRLLESSSGLAWFGLVDELGFGYVAQNVDDVRLPPATLRPLRQATIMTKTTDDGGRSIDERAKP